MLIMCAGGVNPGSGFPERSGGAESLPGTKVHYTGDEEPKAGSGPVNPNAAELAKVREGDEIVAADGIDVRDNPSHIYAGNEGYLKLYNHVQETNGAPVKVTVENTKNKSLSPVEITLRRDGWNRGRA